MLQKMDPNRKGSERERTVGLIDPALEQGGQWDVNLGDEIISESVVSILEQTCGLKIVVRVPSLRKLQKPELDALKDCDFVIVGGTNLLSSNMNKYRQWLIGLYDSFYLKEVILLGVGWWQYQPSPNLYTRILLRRVLNRMKYHSVRDNYTQNKIASLGFKNVLNTSCPTLWGLTPEFQKSIPKRKGTDVVTTITSYKKSPEEDRQLLQMLHRNYREVFLWAQGDEDAGYARDILHDIRILSFELSEYDRFLLEQDDVDYIGTRLHAGIRAIQMKKRALILSVDNRAKEIGRDTNLNTMDRGDTVEIEKWILSEHITDIRLPFNDIQKWVEQFQPPTRKGEGSFGTK